MIYPKTKAMATDRKIPMIMVSAFSVLMRFTKDRVPVVSFTMRSIAMAKVAPRSSKTKETVVDVGNPNVLKKSIKNRGFEIKSKGIKQEDFISGEDLPLKSKKKEIEVYKNKKGKKILIGTIENDYIVQRVACALERGATVKINFTRWKEKEIMVLIKTSVPVFKPDKVEIRPYLRKGTIEEPEMEIEVEEEETE